MKRSTTVPPIYYSDPVVSALGPGDSAWTECETLHVDVATKHAFLERDGRIFPLATARLDPYPRVLVTRSAKGELWVTLSVALDYRWRPEVIEAVDDFLPVDEIFVSGGEPEPPDETTVHSGEE